MNCPSKMIGICYAPHHPYIDHIVPLCQILDIPLLCSDALVEHLIKSYYPSMTVYYEPDIYGHWKDILDNYSTLVYSEFYRRHHGAFQFLDYVYSRKMRSIYSPHGNSDKGQRTFWMERFADEDITLIYGQKMIDFLKEKGVWERLNRPIIVGNYRKAFYSKHKNFFDDLISAELFPSWKNTQKKHRILYVPTWQVKKVMSHDRWDTSSFFSAYPHLFANIPHDCLLFVKLHPNLSLFYEEEIALIKESYRDHENIHFVEDCPLIYPLLSQMDAYIGDLSSIGYDFLTMNRPMFFLNSEQRDVHNDPGLFLYRCGVEILPDQYAHIFEIIKGVLKEPSDPYKTMRSEVDHYAFGEMCSMDKIKQCIEKGMHG